MAKRDGTVIKFPSLTSSEASKSRFSISHIANVSKVNIPEIGTFTSSLVGSHDSDCDDYCNEEAHTEERVNLSNLLPAPNLSKHDYSSTATNVKTPLKAGDDNFISEFYTHSRLHHLATWKSELKKFASSIQKKRNEMSLNKSRLKISWDNRVIMHIDLDSFFVSVALKMQPELIGKPVAVCHSGRGNAKGLLLLVIAFFLRNICNSNLKEYIIINISDQR